MDWDSNKIKTNFNGVIRDAKNCNIQELELKYSEFKNKFEKLYLIAIDAVFTGKVQEAINKLDIMLKARNDMQSGKVSKLHTDMMVGNMLGKQYIYPLTQTPSQEDYNRALKQITKKEQELLEEGDDKDD